MPVLVRTPAAAASLARGLQILELLTSEPQGLTHSEISHRLRLPKSSTTNLLRALTASGYVRQAPNRRYRLSLRLIELGNAVLRGVALRDVARPLLERLVQETGLTAHLAVLDGDEAVYVERVAPQGFIQMHTWVGRRMDTHCTSVGKALIAYLPAEELKTLFAVRGLPRHTPRTITSRRRLVDDLALVRRRGYAVDDEENNLGVRCLAAPVLSRTGEAVVAVGATGTVTQVTPERVPLLGEKLKRVARELARSLNP